MTKADDGPTTHGLGVPGVRPSSRRSLFSSGAALALLGVAGAFGGASRPLPTPITVAAHPDAELLHLCEEFDELQCTLEAWNAGNVDNEEGDASHREWWATLNEIVETPATTLDGLRAKATVLPFAIDEIEDEYGTHSHDHLGLSLCRELLLVLPAGGVG